jgi:hypothetical protein
METSVRLRSNSGSISKHIVWKTEKAVSGGRSAYIFRNVKLYVLCRVDSCILNYTASRIDMYMSKAALFHMTLAVSRAVPHFSWRHTGAIDRHMRYVITCVEARVVGG